MRRRHLSRTTRPSARAAAVRFALLAGLALLAPGAGACGEAEREAGEVSPADTAAGADTAADTVAGQAAGEPPGGGLGEPSGETGAAPAGASGEAPTGQSEDGDTVSATADTTPRRPAVNPPEGSRNWIVAVFRDSVTRDDLDWLAERGFHVDTVMGGTTVRGWLEKDADRSALAGAEGGERIESFHALMRGPGG